MQITLRQRRKEKLAKIRKKISEGKTQNKEILFKKIQKITPHIEKPLWEKTLS